MNDNSSDTGARAPFAQWIAGWHLVTLTALILSLGAVFLETRHAGEVDAIRLLIRLTARVSLGFFCLAFSATAANRMWPNAWTRWQVRRSVSNAVHAKFTARSMVVPVILASLLFGGCANLSNRPSGFLESYDHLKPDPKDGHRLGYVRADWKKSDYTGVLIEPAVVRLTADDQKKITAQEITELAAYSDAALRKALRKEWMIVTTAEPGTLRIRSAITGIDTSDPVLNVLTSLVLCPVDNGGVSMEFEVLDASSGEQLMVLAGFTNCTPLEGLWAFSRFGQAHWGIDRWVAELRKTARPAVTKVAAK